MKSKKWVYLLTGLIPSSKHRRVYFGKEPIWAEGIEGINLKDVGITLERVFLSEKERITKVPTQYECEDRYIFRIGDGIKDEDTAQLFADSVMASLAVVHDTATEETSIAISIPEDVVKKGRFIKIKDLFGNFGLGSEMYFSVMSGVGVPYEVLDYVWNIVPVVMKNKSAMDAANFYRESIMQAWVAHDTVFDIMSQNSDLPSSNSERVRIETAYHIAFKVIEAIIGEPSKDRNKLRTKLMATGINPDEIVGYELYGMKPGKEAIVKKLENMHLIRDKQAAHGGTKAKRPIGYCELKDKQALAQHLLLRHIDYLKDKKAP